MTTWAIAFLIGLVVTLLLAAQPAAPRTARWLRLGAAGAGVVALAAGALLGWRWLEASGNAPGSLANQLFTAPAPDWSNARLFIPDLGVDTEIRRVPIRGGQWDLSHLDETVGLLSGLGRHPNDKLAMVLTGHVSLPPSVPGPFAGLWTLPSVSRIIYRVNGTDYFYAVEETQSIAPADTQSLFVQDGNKLLLVTCTDWNYLSEKYDKRLLVKAVLYDQRPAALE